MKRNTEFAPGEYYHIYNRGVEKRNIFEKHADYERFMDLLYLSNGTKPFLFREVKRKPLTKFDRGGRPVAIGAYVLMPNHFHILVKELEDGGITRFMEKLATGYSMYFNKTHKRVGPLFQGRFKARHAGKDEYPKYLFGYIHLNPIKLANVGWENRAISDRARAKSFLADYRYSSYLEYTGATREASGIIDRAEFPEYWNGPHEFDEFVNDWMDYQDELADS